MKIEKIVCDQCDNASDEEAQITMYRGDDQILITKAGIAELIFPYDYGNEIRHDGKVILSEGEHISQLERDSISAANAHYGSCNYCQDEAPVRVELSDGTVTRDMEFVTDIIYGIEPRGRKEPEIIE